jgi:hypothetical protein
MRERFQWWAVAALACYRRALDIAPTRHHAHTNVCHLVVETGELEAAVAACRRGLRYYLTDANLRRVPPLLGAKR